MPTGLFNRVMKLNIWCISRFSSLPSVHHVSSSPGISNLSGIWRMSVGAVVVLLLLMSGDIEVNPGPLENELTLDDVACVVEEVLDVSAEWYDLGVQLNVRIGTLKNIRAEFSAPNHQLREMLSAWLTDGDHPTWKTLINALRSRMVGASRLASELERKHCQIHRTELDAGGHYETNVFPLLPVTEPVHRVISQQADMQERTFPPRSFPIADKPTPLKSQATTVITPSCLLHQHTQGRQNSPELEVFEFYFSKLVESISHPERLVSELYSQQMISVQLHDETVKIIGLSTICKASKIVAAVKDQIVVNPSVLHKFLSVMRRDPSLVYVADAMSNHYRALLPRKGTDTNLPTLNQLSVALRGLENWYLLGLQLNISTDILDSIEKIHDRRARQCIEMVRHWINNSKNPTWEAIHEALKNIGESVLAEEIASKYNIQPGSSSKPQQIFSQEKKRIIIYFAIVVDKITDILASLVKLDKLLQFLHFYCHLLSPEMPYIDQHILQSSSSVSEVMKLLVPEYINSAETELLEAIIERFECKEAQILLQQYHDRYPINRLLKDMPDPVPDERLDLTRRKRLRAKCEDDFNGARVSDVKRIRTAIEGATGIDLVTPAQHSEGSLNLIFLFPASVIGIFQELCDEDLELLAEVGIMELQIDNFVIKGIEIYFNQRVKSSTQTTSVHDAGEIRAIAKGFDAYIDQRVEQFTSNEKGQLKDLLESIPKSRVEETPSDSFLRQLATHMSDWKKLAPHLGISEQEAEELAHQYPDVDEQRYRVLHFWKQIDPESATYAVLFACLLAHESFDSAVAAMKMLTLDASVQETRKLLQEAYLSPDSQQFCTGVPELQFERRLGIVCEEHLRDIDYFSHFETLEHFSSKMKTISAKSFLCTVAKKKDRLFLIKGPPGSGRTALLRRMCAFWARGFCLRKFILVLWLDLKAHPIAASDVSLKSLLSYSLPLGSNLDSIQQWLERHGTQDILIVIDGIESNDYSSSLLADTEASVILTAAEPIKIRCPSTSYHKNIIYPNQYDLLGLSLDQISKQVIHHYRHNLSRAEEFLLYISTAHDIRVLCFSPPYLAAVLFVFDSVRTKDLPNSWTQLFTRLVHSLLALSSVSDHDTCTILASKAYGVTCKNSTLEWHHSYANFCTWVAPPYHTMMTTGERCCFTLPLLQHYLCAQHIHSLPHDQHVAKLNERTVPIHVRRFYIGLCSTPELAKTALPSTNRLVYATCISEAVIDVLRVVMTSQLFFKKQFLSAFDICRIFQAVYYSGLMCKLEFHQCYFGSLAIEMMARCLKAHSILPSNGAVRDLSLWGNIFADEGAGKLAGGLRVTQSLQELNLSHSKITDNGVCALSSALRVNQSLQELNLSHNKITDNGVCELSEALQVNQSLQELNLSHNTITDIGVFALSAASRVHQNLQELNLSHNKITDNGVCELSEALQVNQCLQELNLSNNDIAADGVCALVGALLVNQSLQKLKLNLTNNKSSAEGVHAVFVALQVNPSLQKLDLTKKEISDKGAYVLAIGLRMNQSLQELDLSGNQITNEGAYVVASALQVNQSLQKVNLRDSQISADGASAMARALQVNQSLHELDLGYNKIKDEGAHELAKALHVNQTLQGLDLMHNEIKEEGASELARALQVNQSLQKLNLRDNKISTEGVRLLVGVWQANPSLHKLKLNFSKNDITDECISELVRDLQVNQSHQDLDLSGKEITDNGACALAMALQVNHSLQVLNLWDNNITDEGMCELARALQVNQSLQELDLSMNKVSDKGTFSLAGALQVNQNLQKLNLSNNKITADGMCALFGALLVNQTLQKLKLNVSTNKSSANGVYAVFVAWQVNPSHQKLDLSKKQISDKGACALSEALQVNQHIQELDLRDNKISTKGALKLARTLQVNQSLQKLHLGENYICDEGAHALAGALQVNQSLQELNLKLNQITDEGVRALAEALQVNQSIRELNLWNNYIRDEGAYAVAEALRVNQCLQVLNLGYNKIKMEGACAVAGALQVNQSLQKLNVMWNYISSQGCSALRKAQLNRTNLEIEGLDFQLWWDHRHKQQQKEDLHEEDQQQEERDHQEGDQQQGDQQEGDQQEGDQQGEREQKQEQDQQKEGLQLKIRERCVQM